jgi:hypothetical protein
VIAATIEIESDVFWLSTTPPGYRSIFSGRSLAIKSLISLDDALPDGKGDDLEHEVVRAVKRAIVSGGGKGKKSTKRKATASDDSD